MVLLAHLFGRKTVEDDPHQFAHGDTPSVPRRPGAPRTDLWAFVKAFGVERATSQLSARISRGAPGDCWPCNLYPGAQGYCLIKFGGRNGRALLAHRVAWAIANNAEPGSALVCHSCDNPICCNPRHLFLGTPKDNMVDMVAKGRCRGAQRKGEKHPLAKLTDGQVAAIIKDGRTSTEISSAYGISRGYVRDLKKGRFRRTCSLGPADYGAAQLRIGSPGLVSSGAVPRAEGAAHAHPGGTHPLSASSVASPKHDERHKP